MYRRKKKERGKTVWSFNLPVEARLLKDQRAICTSQVKNIGCHLPNKYLFLKRNPLFTYIINIIDFLNTFIYRFMFNSPSNGVKILEIILLCGCSMDNVCHWWIPQLSPKLYCEVLNLCEFQLWRYIVIICPLGR